MKITRYPMLLAVSLLGFSHPVVNADEMYVCQSKGAENIITSRPDLYRNCKTLKGGVAYKPGQYKRSNQVNRSIDSSSLNAAGALARSGSGLQPGQAGQSLSVYDRAALYCSQTTQFDQQKNTECGIQQAEGIGFINDLLAKKRREKSHTNTVIAIRNCLNRHKYGEALDYSGAKECIQTHIQAN